MADPLCPSGKLDLSVVGTLQDDLLACAHQDITVSLENVTQLGALCVQVLIAAANSARANGYTLSLTNTSERILRQLSAMGLTPEKIGEGSQ